MKKAQILSQRKLKGDYFLLWLSREGLRNTPAPGQFVMLRAWPGLDPLLARPFSVHDLREDGFAILYQVRGRGTRLLSQLKKGNLVDVLGPLGQGFPEPTTEEVFLVAGGIGIAPFLLAARHLYQRHKLSLFYGARSSSDLLRLKAFKELRIPIYLSTEDGSAGVKGLVTEILRKALGQAKTTIWACGPMPMLKAVAELAQEAGVKAYLSLEAKMACGLGLCLGCVVPKGSHGFLHVCTEGPVVEAEVLFT